VFQFIKNEDVEETDLQIPHLGKNVSYNSKISAENQRKGGFFESYQRVDFGKEIGQYLANAITRKNLEEEEEEQLMWKKKQE